MKKLTHSGYFEGIGGFSLGASYAGIKTVYTCENHPLRHEFLTQILPKAKHEKDINYAKGKKADIFTAGFPCQDISLANHKAQGITGKRSSLFFRFMQIVCLHRPKYVILENSPIITRRGLELILGAFAQIGYDAEWQVISKREVGFEDERERFILVAYPHEIGRDASFQVFNKVSYSYGKQTLRQEKLMERQFVGLDGFKIPEETKHQLLLCDDGISPKLVQPYIEAYGDSIAPPVAQLVFEMIKIHYQFSIECKQ